MNNIESVTRTREIEEFTNLHFIHPVSIRLTRLFARLGVSPNMVSFAGMLCGVLAGVAYYHYQEAIYDITGFALMIAWHILDGTDGQLARLTNSQSEFGKVIDGICDYVTFIAVYLGLGFALQQQYDAVIWGVIVLSGICHAVQSAIYEVQRQEYNFWGHAKTSARLPRLAGLEQMETRGSISQKLMNRLYVLYVRIQYIASRVSIRLYEELAARLERDDDQGQLIRRCYRQVFAPSVRAWAVLSSNYRTAGIFACAILKIPLLYFVIEIVFLTLVTVILVTRQSARYEDFLRFLAALDNK
ncbi:MAG: CDP-alcohol phosphatidyltransferase family protein [Gammaproteobacteria bacterium]